ncbi:acyltransferase family protein [Neorhizobium sp. DAR64872/K0K18]|uniref:acyltransferase family protein n=1 Tax=Neorhizobium sp. DAR64872/K0K18 TaxID=3421958 RepID=UPI003D2883C8
MKSTHILYLDGWRGLAIVAVLVGHFAHVPGINLGPFGVELFFVLSGRLMAEILILKRVKLDTFFFRRFSRIFPALLFLASTLFMVSSVAILSGYNYDAFVEPIDYVASIILIYNYAYVAGYARSALDHIWSLSVEEHCYIFLAVTTWMLRRRQNLVLVTVGLVGMTAMISGIIQQLAFNIGEHQMYWRTDVRSASIFLSFALFLLLANRSSQSSDFAKLISPAAFVMALACNLDIFPIWVKYSIGTLLLAVSLNSLAATFETIKGWLSSKILTTFGMLSYSIYLWQQPFYSVESKIGGVAGMTGAIVCGVLSYLFIEGPSRRYLNQWWDRRMTRSEMRTAPV